MRNLESSRNFMDSYILYQKINKNIELVIN